MTIAIAFLVTCYVAAPSARFYSGDKVGKQHHMLTVACPRRYEIGTILSVEGIGQVKCLDRGGLIYGNHIDIYMDTGNYSADKRTCLKWGRKYLSVTVPE